MRKISLSIVTPTIFGDYLGDLVRMLWEQNSIPFEHIFIIDKPSEQLLRKLERIYSKRNKDRIVRVFISPHYLGASGAYNLGICIARGDYIALVADDLTVPPKFLETLLGALVHNPDFGWVSSYHNHNWRIPFHSNCSIIDRKVLDKVGILDMAFNPLGYEFDELYMRIFRAGYRPHSISSLFVQRREIYSTTLRRIHHQMFERIRSSQNLLLLRKAGCLRVPWEDVPIYKGRTDLEGIEVVKPT